MTKKHINKTSRHSLSITLLVVINILKGNEENSLLLKVSTKNYEIRGLFSSGY